MFTDAIDGSYYTMSVIQLDSVQNLLSSSLLSKNLEIQIYKKVVPVEASTGHARFRRLRLPDFKTIGT
jgi:hypothetical protein